MIDSDKFSSLAVCIKKNILIVNQEHFLSLNGLKFEFSCDNKEVKQNISFLLIYRKNCSKIQEFVRAHGKKHSAGPSNCKGRLQRTSFSLQHHSGLRPTLANFWCALIIYYNVGPRVHFASTN